MFRPPTSTLLTTTILLLTSTTQVHAHIAPWARGIWVGDEGPNGINSMRAVPANPIYNQTKFGPDGWWFHSDFCIKGRPPLDEFLELPAGGKFTVEMSGNKFFTTLVDNGAHAKEFGDGRDTPLRSEEEPHCITTPNLHTFSEEGTAGWAFAISYHNDLSEVTMENLVIFTTNKSTPYRRLATFEVPADLPECPPGGCICAALWIPNHCGLANEYMIGYNCKVTNVKPTARALGKAQTPVWCEGEPEKCVKGPKGMIVFAQQEGNNIDITGQQKDGWNKSPGYNLKTGFQDGAQNDIFVDAAPQPTLSTADPQPTLANVSTQPTPGRCQRPKAAKNRMG